MTTNIRRAAIISLTTLLGLATACSEHSSLTAPVDGPRNSGYTVTADRADSTGGQNNVQTQNRTQSKKNGG